MYMFTLYGHIKKAKYKYWFLYDISLIVSLQDFVLIVLLITINSELYFSREYK